MDNLTQQLNSRFASHDTVCFRIQQLVPAYVSSTTFHDLEELLVMYKNDLASRSVIKSEFERWQVKWEKITELPKTAIDSLAACDAQCFPNIHRLLHIFATIPVTSATAERSFSTLRRLLTYLRTTMGENRLNGLAHMSINKDIEVVVDDVIRNLSLQKRRLKFAI